MPEGELKGDPEIRLMAPFDAMLNTSTVELNSATKRRLLAQLISIPAGVWAAGEMAKGEPGTGVSAPVTEMLNIAT